MDRRLAICTFGSLNIHLAEEEVSGLASRKAEALLVYLACNPRPHPREVLADLLWDDRTQKQAQANLRVVLSSLRKEVGDYIDITREAAGVRPGAEIWLDVAQLEATLQQRLSAATVAEYEGAVALYQGEFLEGFFIREASGFEAWQVRERERLHRLALDGLQRLVDQALACGNYAAGTGHANRLLELEPLSETAHRQLTELLARSGQREQALALYEQCRGVLWDELGIEPADETEALVAAIRAGELEPTPQAAPPPPNNLPAQVTSFVGRRRQLAETAGLLAQSRLLTLTGPGGSGKTRLAQELAAEQLGNYRDGAYFVSLASLSAPELVVEQVAGALGLQPAHSQNLERAILDYLAHKQLLLVMDNYEHLLDGATVVSRLLEAADQLQVVATSREPLLLRGEQRYPVPPLILPENGRLSAAEAAEVEAIQLFVDRARAAEPTFRLTEANLPTVMAICRRLDGLPLALELAAARLSSYSPEQILERLTHSLAMLTGGLRDLPRRQRTLRNTIAWSYDLLDADEQRLFGRLGVFAGRWLPEDCQAVCGEGLPWPVAGGLAALVQKNLVVVRPGPAGERGYEMLATIRDFAVEQLHASGEAPAVHARLAHYLVEHLSAAKPDYPRGASWIAYLDFEADNIRTGLTYFLKNGEVAPALALLDASYAFWEVHARQGSGWFDRLLAILGDQPTAIRCRALFLQGALYLFGYDNRRAAGLLEESVRCNRCLDDQPGLYQSLCALGQACLALGEYERMHTRWAEAIEAAEKLDDPAALNWAIFQSTFGSTDFEKSKTILQGLLASAEEDGRSGFARTMRQGLAWVEIPLGNYDAAAEQLQDCIIEQRELGQDSQVIQNLELLGEAEIRRGRLAAGCRALSEGLQKLVGCKYVDEQPYFYERFALLAICEGEFERAARLFGAAEAARELPGGMPINPEFRPDYERDVARLQANMPEAELNAVWQHGRAMSIEQATAYALRG